MREIKCPHCGTTFKVDEADYATIASQVRNAEFEEELERRIASLKSEMNASRMASDAEAEKKRIEDVGKKDMTIAQKDAEIARLKAQISSSQQAQEIAVAKAVSDLQAQVADLRSQIQQKDSEAKIAVLEQKQKAQEDISSKNAEIADLKAAGELAKSQAEVRENSIRQDYENRLKVAQEQVDYYKDLKTRMSTKMVGETLEAHCSTEYETKLRPFLQSAYFEKDNDASGGSKGDFIFRDFSDGMEYVSIMFEMKNEMDTTTTKHKNEDFFRKLDEDRKAKGCEYAVLVSLLESDSELYNSGIVDVSHKYPKMYVVRPQFFVPIITLLSQTSKKTVMLQKELEEARNQSVDVTDFEKRLQDFQTGFAKNYLTAEKYFESVIADLDKAIAALEKTKKDLTTTGNQLRLANNKAQEVTIKKLTRGNPTMTQMFLEASKKIEG